MARTVAEAARAMDGRVVAGEGDLVWCRATLDSREVDGGELFFALPGERRDGHEFVADALAAGARAAVVHEEVEAAGGAIVRVDDTYEALHELTRSIRSEVPERLVAITGSTGKTTTKELLAILLAPRFRVAKSPGNLNNLYGFPVSLLGIPDDTEWMVAEMGMSTPGELAGVSRLGRPDVVVFTNIRPVHLEQLETVEAIAEAKAEILTGLEPDGLVVTNADDPGVSRISERHPGRRVRYGIDADAEVLARDIEVTAHGGTRFVLVADGDSAPVALPLHGRYNVENFLAAAACAWTLGVEIETIAASAGDATPASKRGVVHRLAGDVTVVDDSYNSNPSALERAYEAAAELPARRRVAVLGDMLELGDEAPRFHRGAGRQAERYGFSPVVGVGELSRELVEEAAAAGADAIWRPDAEAAAETVAELVRDGDLVLVKGSRGIGLERVVARLLTERTPEG